MGLRRNNALKCVLTYYANAAYTTFCSESFEIECLHIEFRSDHNFNIVLTLRVLMFYLPFQNMIHLGVKCLLFK